MTKPIDRDDDRPDDGDDLLDGPDLRDAIRAGLRDLSDELADDLADELAEELECCAHPAPGSVAIIAGEDRGTGQAVRAILSEMGIDGLIVDDGDDALRYLYRLGSVSLFVTDLLVAGKDGLQLIMEAKAFDPELPVLALAGGSHAEARLHSARVRGADHALKRPFSRNDLMAAVEIITGEVTIDEDAPAANAPVTNTPVTNG